MNGWVGRGHTGALDRRGLTAGIGSAGAIREEAIHAISVAGDEESSCEF
jgi:hypothetical protein